MCYLPDGKHLLAVGIEPGHGVRDYLIDVGTGESKPVTTEGVSGVVLSDDGRQVVVTGPDSQTGIWTFGGSALRPIPGFDPMNVVSGWTPDGKSLYVTSRQVVQTAKVYRLDVATGKLEFWKEFGIGLPANATRVGVPRFSADSTAYAYSYDQVLCQAYVVKGFK